MVMLLSHYSPSATSIRRSGAPPARRPRRALLLPLRVWAETTGVATEAALLRSGLRPESLSRHVAVVMDGNSRWARARGLSVADGHKAGGRNLERIAGLSRAWGVRVLTAFVCSQENLSRPKAEIESLMGLLEWLLGANIDRLSRQGVRLQVIGDASRMPGSLRRAAVQADEATRHNSQLHVMLAICYSGRWDMVQACRELAWAAQANALSPDDIDESLLAGKLATSTSGEFSNADLVIRTGGELRLSNFLLWQAAYSEFVFSDKMWPDFGEAKFLEALRSFQSRDRRFGLTKIWL